MWQAVRMVCTSGCSTHNLLIHVHVGQTYPQPAYKVHIFKMSAIYICQGWRKLLTLHYGSRLVKMSTYKPGYNDGYPCLAHQPTYHCHDNHVLTL